MGNVVTADDREKYQNIIKTAMEDFGTTYAQEYKSALIEHVKEECAGEDEEDGPQLVDPPPEKGVVKAGWMKKKGEGGMIGGAFKDRYFVALKEADNYDIAYFTGEVENACFEEPEEGEPPAATGRKGQMSIGSYKPRVMTGDETQQFGEHGIILVPPKPEKQRTWILLCKDAEDQQAWLTVCKDAAKRAGPPLNPNEVDRTAYQAAYNTVSENNGFGKTSLWWGTEQDMLGGLVHDICYRDCLQEVYERVPDNPLKNKIISTIKKSVQGAIRAAVSAGWTACNEASQKIKDPVSEQVKNAIAPVLEAESNLKSQMVDQTGGIVDPAIQKFSEKLAPIVEVLVNNVSAAYIGAVREWINKLPEHNQEVADGQSVYWVSRNMYWECWGQTGTMAPVYENSAAMIANPALEVVGQINEDYDADKIAFNMIGSIQTLLRKAIHYWYTEARGSDAPTASESVKNKLIHDAGLEISTFFEDTFGGLIGGPIDDEVLPAVEDILAPMEEQVPEPVKEIVNPKDTFVGALEEMRDNAISAMIDPHLQPHLTELNAL